MFEKKTNNKETTMTMMMTSRTVPFYLNHNTSFQCGDTSLLPSQIFESVIDKLKKSVVCDNDYFIAFTRSKKHFKIKGKITHDMSYCIFRIEVYESNIVECSNREGCSILFLNLFKFLKHDILLPQRYIATTNTNRDFEYYLHLIDNTIECSNYVDLRLNFVSALLIVTETCTDEQLCKVDSF